MSKRNAREPCERQALIVVIVNNARHKGLQKENGRESKKKNRRKGRVFSLASTIRQHLLSDCSRVITPYSQVGGISDVFILRSGTTREGGEERGRRQPSEPYENKMRGKESE